MNEQNAKGRKESFIHAIKETSPLRPLFFPLFSFASTRLQPKAKAPQLKPALSAPTFSTLLALQPPPSRCCCFLYSQSHAQIKINTHICDPRANCKHACINIYKTNPVVAAATRLIINLRLEGRRPSAPSPFPPTGTWASCWGRSAAPRLHKM